MVIVPGLTHLAILAINQISKRKGVILIDNGLSEEREKSLINYCLLFQPLDLRTIACLDNKW